MDALSRMELNDVMMIDLDPEFLNLVKESYLKDDAVIKIMKQLESKIPLKNYRLKDGRLLYLMGDSELLYVPNDVEIKKENSQRMA